MKYLIVYANPEPNSFCHAIVTILQETLTAEDKEVIVRDLYEDKFDPIMDIADFISIGKNDYLIEIKEEHEYIQEAAMIIFVYPIWWMGPPAIMKGYFDRVFTDGFAYSADENGLEKGFIGKKVVVINTMGIANEYYESVGLMDAMKKIMNLGIFEYTGLDLIEHKFYGGLSSMDEQERKNILEEIKVFAQELSQNGVEKKAPTW